MTTVCHDRRGGIAPAATRGGWILPEGSSIEGGFPGSRRANASMPGSHDSAGNAEGQRANASLLPQLLDVIACESVSGFTPDAFTG